VRPSSIPTTNQIYVRLTLAQSLWNIVWLLHYFSAEAYLLMPYKPGLGQGHNQKKDIHTLSFDVTLGPYLLIVSI